MFKSLYERATVAGLRVVVRFHPDVSEPLFVLGIKYINQNGRVERALNTIMRLNATDCNRMQVFHMM